MKRWSVRSFFKIDWQWPRDTIKPLENALDRRVEVVDRNKYKLDSLNLVTLHFDGEMDLRDFTRDQMNELLDLAEKGVGELVAAQRAAVA